MSRWQRIALLIGFFVVVVAAAWGLYWVFFRPLPPTTVEPVTNGGGTGVLPTPGPAGPLVPAASTTARLPGLPAGELGPFLGVAPAAPSSVVGAAVGQGGTGLQYYDASRRQFVKLLPDGRIVPLTDQKFYNVRDVIWAPTHDRAVLVYPDGTKTYYDFTQQRQVTLPKQMEDITFNATGEKIASLWVGDIPEDRWLVTSNPDGGELQLIEPLADKASQFEVGWSPNGQVVGTFSEGSDGGRQEVFPIGRQGENFSSFIAPGYGFTSEYLPAGERMLYSVYNPTTDGRPQLFIADARSSSFGANTQRVGLATWPDRCTTSGSAVFCGVVRDLPPYAGVYPDLADGLPEDVWRVDLATGQRERIGSLPSGVNAARVFTSPDGSAVYVVDRTTGRLFTVPVGSTGP